ncbi:MAG: valine--tRNA ligase [Rickettsiales bacterium]|jgi:valyl-tRNA synthetase|nr:valine--tRNA ligase [Rickettsiales bacterium]
MTHKLDDRYDHQAIENRWTSFWDKEQIYKFDPARPRAETFALDTPPPTVSGSLHIGHIFGYTQADIGARFQRMLGKNIFFPIGWDDNGLPTERRVQNYFNIKCDPTLAYDPNFKAEHKDKFDAPQTPVSRRNFIEHCRALVDQDEKIFENIFRGTGMSYDWSLMYSTISPDAIRLAQESFIKLYKSGNVKSVEAPTMWDVDFQTAVAQAEIEDKEIAGHFHDIRFKCGSDEFTIATTRPELLPAIIAIVAHPDDLRYKKFFGKTATSPIFKTEVPIMPSEHANPEKGTGIMMVCTFGDQEDVNFWKTHKMPLKQIIGRDGKIFDVPELEGLRVKQARKKIVEMLRESGDLIGEPKPITHAVKFYEKGDSPIEFVSSRQWFVSMMDKKEAMVQAAGKIKWTPEHMKARFINWADGINQDWLISRQRFFGVPFPVWYKLDAKGSPIHDEPILSDKLPCDPATDVPAGFSEAQRNQPNGFAADPDVIDTWATSALTPAIAMAKTDAKNLSVPFSARWNGHDIIRTWDFCTVLITMLNFGGELPWEQLWINGFVLDPDRKKMSKSKGNVVVPKELVDKFGADAIRVWAASAKWGTDGIADEKIMEQKRKLVMKFFNAAKFVYGFAGDTKNIAILPSDNPVDLAYAKKLEQAAEESKKYFEQNDHTGALIATEQAFWDFCDNYLEIVKGRAYAGDDSALKHLRNAILEFAAMSAPFMPFIAEEIFQAHPYQKFKEWSLDNKNDIQKSIHLCLHPALWKKWEWPLPGAEIYEKVRGLVSFVRGKKSENNFSMKKGIKRLAIKDDADLRAAEADIKNVLNVSELEFKMGLESGPEITWSDE